MNLPQVYSIIEKVKQEKVSDAELGEVLLFLEQFDDQEIVSFFDDHHTVRTYMVIEMSKSKKVSTILNGQAPRRLGKCKNLYNCLRF